MMSTTFRGCSNTVCRVVHAQKPSIRYTSFYQHRSTCIKAGKSPSLQESTLAAREVRLANSDPLLPGMMLCRSNELSDNGELPVRPRWKLQLSRRNIGICLHSEGRECNLSTYFTSFSRAAQENSHISTAKSSSDPARLRITYRAPISHSQQKNKNRTKILRIRQVDPRSSGKIRTIELQNAVKSRSPRYQRPYSEEGKTLKNGGSYDSIRSVQTLPEERAYVLQGKAYKRSNQVTSRSNQKSVRQTGQTSNTQSFPLAIRSPITGLAPMPSDSSNSAPLDSALTSTPPAQHKPLVVGLKKPQQTNTMATSEAAAALNEAINENVKENVSSAGPAEEPKEQQPKQKKEKAPKQPKQPKAAPAAAPTSPALIDLRVGHILRAIAHPNADSLYVSTIAMGDPEGTEHTQVDEETGKVVRTVCSGLKAYIPLEEMQDRKIIVVANLKPVNMRSIKSAAMVLAASPKPEEGADPHAADRVVELVIPPTGSEAGDKVYFEGWPYGEGKGPEKVLNPKKKQWEAIQSGFFTSDDLKVGFNAGVCDEVEGSEKGDLVVEGKGVCTVKSLKGAVVR